MENTRGKVIGAVLGITYSETRQKCEIFVNTHKCLSWVQDGAPQICERWFINQDNPHEY